MDIKLSAKDRRYIEQKLAAGRFKSASAVIAQALTVLRNVEAALPSANDDLRREIDRGLRDIEEGRVEEWKPEELIEEIRGKGRRKRAS